MKKRVLAVLAVLVLAGSMVFAEGSYFFKNTIKSKIVNVDNTGNTVMGATYEEMEAGYFCEKVDIYAKARVITDNGTAAYPVAIGYDPEETYFGITFKPGYGTFVGLGSDLRIPGSYLYVEDDNEAMGKLCSPGLSVGYKNTLGDNGEHTISAVSSLSFISGVAPYYFNAWNFSCGGYYMNTIDDVTWSLGAMYKYEFATDDHRAGVYGTVTVAGLDICAGFNYNTADSLYVDGTTINFSFGYGLDFDNGDAGSLFICADYITDFIDSFYYAVAAAYTIPEDVEKLDFDVEVWCGAYECSYSDYAGTTEYTAGPTLVMNTEKVGKFKFGCDVNFTANGFSSIEFPCKWVYTIGN